MSFTEVIAFANPDDFTFDDSKLQVTALGGALKDNRPEDATAAIPFSVNFNQKWGDDMSKLAGTAIAGAVITDGALDLTSSDQDGVSFVNGNHPLGSRFCVRIRIKPNFDGSPGAKAYLWQFGNGGANEAYLYMASNGSLRLNAKNSSGGALVDRTTPVIAWDSNTWYVIECNVDVISGASRIFLQGTQTGTTHAGIGTRTTDTGSLYIGRYPTIGNGFDGFIKNVMLFDAIQHTADYDPTYTIPSLYYTDNPYMQPNTDWRHHEIKQMLMDADIEGNDEITLAFSKDGKWYYFNETEGEWEETDGKTYSETTTIAVANANWAAFTDSSVRSAVRIFFHSDDGGTTPLVRELQVEYDPAGEDPDTVTLVEVWGWGRDEQGDPDQTQITFRLANDFAIYGEYAKIRAKDIPVTPDAKGYWEVKLPDTASMQGDQYYNADFGDGNIEGKQIPLVSRIAWEKIAA
jgi:hypothetical protein